MAKIEPLPKEACEVAPATLGDVLYARRPAALVPESEWVALVRRVARGDHAALHSLYERAHRLVFTLSVRITGSVDTAEELTLDVFHDVWRRAERYDPAGGSVLGWIMNQARSRAIDRMRFEQRKKRTAPGGEALAGESIDSAALLEHKEQCEALRAALAKLGAAERLAIETAYFGELSYADAARRLDVPLGTVKTRIRLGMERLRQALSGS